ncbi:SAM-dependent methyltransferase [Pararhodobacter sp. SW119]|uniref:class I SAM-dependent methyltransferase n=1 Tax=Pararhodobacter sp. SW119 TaxID=2780075 RepID=UPI001ADEE8BC|nr:SAM-dependent methyltransferase [Pararhodobacter sp. SW119]
MTPLADRLAARIAATGPMTLAEYMLECLLDPQQGYYATRDPLGAAGDFTTAPEISQIFGELAGLSLAQSWLDQGAPAPFALAELGPGRGTLMADIWRAATIVPGFHAAAHIHLVEASDPLRAAQARALRGLPVIWHARADDLPDAPLWLIANEFFDALPIRQFQRAGPAWRERVVGLQGGRLAIGLTDPAPRPDLADRLTDTPESGIVELRPAAEPVMAAIEARIATRGGAAVLIDYGDWGSRGDTFQALRGHAFADPFADPGQADLTAHVDFAALARAAPALHASCLTPQGVWLDRLGIRQRTARLGHSLQGSARAAHDAATHRLTDGAEMGNLFKVLALVQVGAPMPPGLEPGPEPDRVRETQKAGG